MPLPYNLGAPLQQQRILGEARGRRLHPRLPLPRARRGLRVADHRRTERGDRHRKGAAVHRRRSQCRHRR